MSGPSVGVVVARHTRAGDPDYSCFNRAPSATCPFDCKVQDWEDGGKWKYASATLAALRKRAETIANWTPEQLARRPASKSSARRRRASTCAPRRRQRRRRIIKRAQRRACRTWPIGRPSSWRVAPRRSRPRGVVARPRARRVAGRGDCEPESGRGGARGDPGQLDARAAGASPCVQVVRAASSRVHVRAASQAAATANYKAGAKTRVQNMANWTPEQLARRPASKPSARRRRASTCAPRRRPR